MDILREILLSVTITTVFSSIIINIFNKSEILKISCSLLIVISLVTPLSKIDLFDFDLNFDDYTYKNEEYMSEASDIQKELLQNELNDFLKSEYGIYASVLLSDDLEVLKIEIFDDTDISKLEEILGIKIPDFEYIKSR